MKRSTLNKIIESLEGNADGWTFSEYAARHRKSDSEIWTGNGHYGLHVIADGVKFGDVTFASSLFGAIIPWRRKLLKAVHEAALRRMENGLRRDVA